MATTIKAAGQCVINGGPPVELICINVTREQIDITTRHEPDPDWEYVDPAGHYHARSRNKETPYPTLRADVEHRDCNGACDGADCEGYDTTVYRCRVCGADVEPGVRETVGRRYMDGLESWQVDVRGAVDAPGRPVSVVIRSGLGVQFGFAVVSEVSAGPGGAVTATLMGSGPLGRRP